MLAPADPHPRPASPPPHGWGTEAAAGLKPVLRSLQSDRKATEAKPLHGIFISLHISLHCDLPFPKASVYLPETNLKATHPFLWGTSTRIILVVSDKPTSKIDSPLPRAREGLTVPAGAQRGLSQDSGATTDSSRASVTQIQASFLSLSAGNRQADL